MENLKVGGAGAGSGHRDLCGHGAGGDGQICVGDGYWDAKRYFEFLTARNRLARKEGFRFAVVSGLEGFENFIDDLQSRVPYLCLADGPQGYTDLLNSAHTRNIKTVFLFMPHAENDMRARDDCMATMRELFRQLLSRFLRDRMMLRRNKIYLDGRISFSEMESYMFASGAAAYFQIAADVYTDLSFRKEEWDDGTDSI